MLTPIGTDTIFVREPYGEFEVDGEFLKAVLEEHDQGGDEVDWDEIESHVYDMAADFNVVLTVPQLYAVSREVVALLKDGPDAEMAARLRRA